MAHENSLLHTRLTFTVINVQTGGLMTTFSELVAGYCQDQVPTYNALHYHQTAV